MRHCSCGVSALAVSDDLQHWEKLPANPTSLPDPTYYEIVSTGQRRVTHWRDPFLFDAGEEVIQYVCAWSVQGAETSHALSASARSTDMVSWEGLPPPEHDCMTEEMEVPKLYEIDIRYYLVFCTHDYWLDPAFVSRFPGHTFRSTDYSMVGDSPLGPFRMHGTGQIMPQDPSHWFYASQLVQLAGTWFLLGTFRTDAGSGITDPLPVADDEAGLRVTAVTTVGRPGPASKGV